ncbi:TonB-dependent receptor plug domain-containing protein, partial [Aquimarina agarilytica]|uniref:TonB-dependent receptor plug domain-containing protein n=1 Tax=Aquimarina agarilytica TaxID=1087449 RepID=UPI0002892F27
TFFKKCADHFLEEKLHLLNEVVIKEYLSSGVSLKNDGTVHFDLKKADILAGQAEPDVLQSTQLLPGIDNVSENASDILIRGGTPDQNLVLWDDIKLYNTDHFFGTLTNLNSTIIDNVTIYKSGTSAQYGNRVSGVIDIKLDDSVPEKSSKSFGFNMLSTDFAIKTPFSKKIGFIVSGRRSITDVVQTSTFDNNFSRIFQNSRTKIIRDVFETTPNGVNNQSIVFEDYTAKLLYQIAQNHKLTSTFLYTNNTLKDAFDAILDGFPFEEPFIDFLTIKNLGTSLSLSSGWNSKLDTKLSFSYSNYSLEYFGFSYSPVFFFPHLLERQNEVDDVSVSFKSSYKLKKLLTLSCGYELSSKRINYAITDGVFGRFKGDYKNKPAHSIYSQLTYNKTKATHFDFGIRLNKFANFDKIKIEPRLYVEKVVHQNFRIKTSAEIKNQAINRIEIFTGNEIGEEAEVWLPSIQDSIPLVKSKQVTLGVLFKKKNWVVDIDSYYKELKGLSAFNTRQFNVFDTPEEGEGIIKGIDVLLKKKIQNYSIWLSYTYAQNDQRFNNINENKFFNANNDITHSIMISNFLKWKKFQFSLGWKYKTGIPFTIIKSFDGDAIAEIDLLNSERLPDYHRLDFSLNYSFLFKKNDPTKNFKIGLGVQNLYNKKNILAINYTDLEIDPEEFDRNLLRVLRTESLGITPNVFLRFNF